MLSRVKVTRSPGSVFRDVGLSRAEAEHLTVRGELMLELHKAISKKQLTQAAAARLLGVHPPRISDLMRGRIDLFSIETLIDMLARLGVSVRIVTGRARKRAGAA